MCETANEIPDLLDAVRRHQPMATDSDTTSKRGRERKIETESAGAFSYAGYAAERKPGIYKVFAVTLGLCSARPGDYLFMIYNILFRNVLCII